MHPKKINLDDFFTFHGCNTGRLQRYPLFWVICSSQSKFGMCIYTYQLTLITTPRKLRYIKKTAKEKLS